MSFSRILATGNFKVKAYNPVTLACDGTIPRVLDVGGFDVKAMGFSGELDGAALVKLGGIVFGVRWNTARDEMSVVFRVNVFQHNRGNPTGADLTRDTLDQLDSAVMTDRMGPSASQGLCNQ